MCSPWGHKELDTTWQLNNNNKNEWFHVFSFPKKKFFFNFVFVYTRSLLWRVGFSLQWSTRSRAGGHRGCGVRA